MRGVDFVTAAGSLVLLPSWKLGSLTESLTGALNKAGVMSIHAFAHFSFQYSCSDVPRTMTFAALNPLGGDPQVVGSYVSCVNSGCYFMLSGAWVQTRAGDEMIPPRRRWLTYPSNPAYGFMHKDWAYPETVPCCAKCAKSCGVPWDLPVVLTTPGLGWTERWRTVP